ncbi:unnamed protein product [Larinioides sclopetarius]|uniref:Uncharacterized protein n=1 Tax=Larinioides sclopetarius TaxID=280406 RepID=A0AAV2C020_9ARAC
MKNHILAMSALSSFLKKAI